MSKIRVFLETGTDIAQFVNIANTIKEDVFLKDAKGFVADAKSLMGVMYGKFEFKELWVESENESIATKFLPFLA